MTKEEAKHHIDVLKAYIEEKEIQWRIRSNDRQSEKWNDCYNPSFDFANIEYRIKSEPKYRPYNSAEEFLKVQKEHGPYLEKMGEFYLPTSVRQDAVLWGFCTKWKDLLNYYKWQDGAPCGILENE